MSEEKTIEIPEVGDVVVYHEPDGQGRNALITSVHGGSPYYLVNLIFVSGNENETDVYGRQTSRATSVTHKSNTDVHGNYWHYLEETPNPYKEPLKK